MQALTIGNDGTATAVSTVFDPATVAPGCLDPTVLMGASGDFYVVASCGSSINVYDVHDGVARPYGALLGTTGWDIGDAQIDTTGHVITVDWGAPPQSPLCVEVDGSARFIDGVPTAITLQTTPGCINPGGSAQPAQPATS